MSMNLPSGGNALVTRRAVKAVKATGTAITITITMA
jgi:hypothetical protein